MSEKHIYIHTYHFECTGQKSECNETFMLRLFSDNAVTQLWVISEPFMSHILFTTVFYLLGFVWCPSNFEKAFLYGIGL